MRQAMTDLNTNDLVWQNTLARIDRAQAELADLTADTRQFVAEQHDLMAGATKPTRDVGLVVWMSLMALPMGVAALTIAAVAMTHH
jgi:hypothetical protein